MGEGGIVGFVVEDGFGRLSVAESCSVVIGGSSVETVSGGEQAVNKTMKSTYRYFFMSFITCLHRTLVSVFHLVRRCSVLSLNNATYAISIITKFCIRIKLIFWKLDYAQSFLDCPDIEYNRGMIDFSIVIQAGGQSTRMGRDKGLVSFGRGTLLEHILSQLQGYKRDTFIISNNIEDYTRFGLAVYADVITGIGALGGVYSALYYAKTDYILLLAVDMPFVNLDLLNYLLEEASGYDVVIPKVSERGFLEPFRAVYSRRCLAPIKQKIDAGQRKVISFFDLVSVNVIEPEELARYDPEGETFFNLNTPEDLEKARTMLDE